MTIQRLLACGFALSLAACASRGGVPDASAFQAQNAAYAQSANAKSASLYSGLVPKVSAIETVPADQAPPPPAGSGWYCYEARTTRVTHSSPRGDVRTERPCHRSEATCRAAADKAARQRASSPNEELDVRVSPCAPRATANCTHLWFGNGSGGDICVAGDDACREQMLGVTTPGSAVRQSECREVK